MSTVTICKKLNFLLVYRCYKYNSKFEHGEDSRLPTPNNFNTATAQVDRCDECACESDDVSPPVPPRSAKPKRGLTALFEEEFVDLDLPGDDTGLGLK